MRLTHARLLVEVLDGCFRFYRDLLGLSPRYGEEGGRYADFDTGGGAMLALFRRDLMADATGARTS